MHSVVMWGLDQSGKQAHNTGLCLFRPATGSLTLPDGQQDIRPLAVLYMQGFAYVLGGLARWRGLSMAHRGM